MKTTSMKTLPAISFLAALVAFVLFPHNLAMIGSLLFAASIVSIFVADYTRTLKPLTTRATVVNFPRPGRRAATFELAA
jgi:hypothetical protein